MIEAKIRCKAGSAAEPRSHMLPMFTGSTITIFGSIYPFLVNYLSGDSLCANMGGCVESRAECPCSVTFTARLPHLAGCSDSLSPSLI